ncbi:MAG: pyridoxamine 5'-phosphate oxidase family protein [Candidatus Fermentibacteraceae bacterium]
MKRDEVLEFVRTCETSFMATIENGEPRVRAMDTPHVDAGGLTFCTGSTKDVCLQLMADPMVELCYWNEEKNLQLRIRGKMARLSDLDLLKHIVNTRFTFLQPVVERFGWEALALFRLSGGEVRSWSPENLSGVVSEVFEF